MAQSRKHRELHSRSEIILGPDGTFRVPFWQHIVRIYPPQHLEPEPVAFELTDAAPLRELDLSLDPGRALPIVVIGLAGVLLPYQLYTW